MARNNPLRPSPDQKELLEALRPLLRPRVIYPDVATTTDGGSVDSTDSDSEREGSDGEEETLVRSDNLQQLNNPWKRARTGPPTAPPSAPTPEAGMGASTPVMGTHAPEPALGIGASTPALGMGASLG